MAEAVRTSDGKHTTYCMRAVMIGARGTDRKSWEVRRRYSEFHDLHTRMKALGAVHSDLPSRNPLTMMGAMVKEKIQRERERGLQEYLNAVLERCTDDQCLLLAKFLRVNKHMNQHHDLMSNGSGSPCPSFATNMSHVSHHQSVEASIDSQTPHCRPMNVSADMAAARRSGVLRREEAQGSLQRRHAFQRGQRDGGPAPPPRTPPLPDDDQVHKEPGNLQQQQRRILDSYTRPPPPSTQQAQGSTCRGAEAPAAAARLPAKKAAGGFGADAKDAAKAGVGLFFVQNEGEACEVDEIIPGSSAHADGRIAIGDVLLAVDGRSVAGKHLGQARDMIVGAPDTSVSLTFVRLLDGHSPSDPTSPGGAAAKPRSTEFTVTLVRSVKRRPGSEAAPLAMPQYLNAHAVQVEATPLSHMLVQSAKQPATKQAPAATAGATNTRSPTLEGEVGGVGSAGRAQRVGAFNAERLTLLDGETCTQSFTTELSRDKLSRAGQDSLSLQGSVPSVSSSGAIDTLGLAKGRESASFAQASGGDDGFQPVLTVRALCGFCAQKSHELSFDHGEILVVVRKHDSGWWDACSTKTGDRGWLPSNHVEQVDAQCIVMDEAARAIVQAVKTTGQQQAPQTTFEDAVRGSSRGEAPGTSQRQPRPVRGQHVGVTRRDHVVGGAVAGAVKGGADEDSSQSLRSTVTADTSAVEDSSADVPGLPTRLSDMTVDNVCLWLEALDLGRYCALCAFVCCVPDAECMHAF